MKEPATEALEAIMALEIKSEYLGHGSDGSKLYIDGKVVDSSRFLRKGVANCRGGIVDADGKTHIVEVRYTGFWDGVVILNVNDKELARAKLT
ncbi:hypothetical protein KIP88_19755 [Bradyrhizobium sp. SRL28]|uniref:hypothetical protein n=1 Tax=Bradyrhizobium sp. SRL28 TaxID=2836178 RepID=UPI001BDDDAF5|nr:hypothetical protein [Bradyrhizobium sp. SRL28]MBT1512739.1 hypothetical protein [Bradyrhizobium sp. SRL28]